MFREKQDSELSHNAFRLRFDGSGQLVYSTCQLCSHVPLLNNAVELFECLPQDDLEHRIKEGMRPSAFAKGTKHTEITHLFFVLLGSPQKEL